MIKEVKMKLRTKAAILLAAALLTFAGFSLIATSGADDIVKVGKEAGYEMISIKSIMACKFSCLMY